MPLAVADVRGTLHAAAASGLEDAEDAGAGLRIQLPMLRGFLRVGSDEDVVRTGTFQPGAAFHRDRQIVIGRLAFHDHSPRQRLAKRVREGRLSARTGW